MIWSLCLAASWVLPAYAQPAPRKISHVSGYARFHSRKATAAGGRLLLTELSCTACHKTSRQELAAKSGPDLTNVAARVQQQWLERFLASPATVKPGTTMPALLSQFRPPQRQRLIRALASFLNSRQQAAPRKTTGKGDREKGDKLFHTAGCIACHGSTQLKQVSDDDDGVVRPGRPTRRELVPSVPLPQLNKKYGQAQLALFLHDPLRVRAAGRMPQLVSQQEAAHIAAYLTGGQHKKWVTDSGLIEQGGRLFNQLGCAECHSFNRTRSKRRYPTLQRVAARLNQGCLSSSSVKTPRYQLDRGQRQSLQLALQSFSAQSPQPPNRTIANVLVTAEMKRLNCFACHRRQQLGGVGARRYPFFHTKNDADLGDEGKIPPDLTDVGNKLTDSWIKRVFAGTGSVRPHMMTRMPFFGDRNGKALTRLFLTADRSANVKPAKTVMPGKAHVNSGRLLAGTGCIQCHAINGKRLPGVLGIDLALLKARINPAWFRRFLLEPNKVRPRTRMPSFWLNGKSTNRVILNGNMEDQLASLWAYLAAAKTQPLPLAMQRKNTFELRPVDRPILFRTFFKGAGTHAVAVGYPQERHTVFDSAAVRFAFLWRGRFVDAHGTWFNRFQPLTTPLGKSVMALPPGVPFANIKADQPWPTKSGESAGYRMLGYRLTRQGVPTFLYRWKNLSVRDTIRPNATSTGMQRTIQFSGGTKSFAFRVYRSKSSIKAIGPRRFQLSNQARIELKQAAVARVRKPGAVFELLVDLTTTQAPSQLVLEYIW